MIFLLKERRIGQIFTASIRWRLDDSLKDFAADDEN
jgi:hypothetical protein